MKPNPGPKQASMKLSPEQLRRNGVALDMVSRRMPAQRPGQSRQDYATPDALIEAVKRRFDVRKFSYDLAASPENAKARHFFTEEEDSLGQDWLTLLPGDYWLNPPFSRIDLWAQKCAGWLSACVRKRTTRGRIFFLTPASIGSSWFIAHIHNVACVYALRGRLSFDGIGPYPKDCILSVYDSSTYPKVGFDVWDWRRWC